ncbi:MAG TPA: hypothetical protein VK686_24265 [Bryobacteraceae bacterium]|nr:hypothetical protein [Bryobacteraceae bacterium]
MSLGIGGWGLVAGSATARNSTWQFRIPPGLRSFAPLVSIPYARFRVGGDF